MRWLLIFLFILAACPHKEIKPPVNSFYLSYLGDLSKPINLNYLTQGKGLRIAYLSVGNGWILQGLDFKVDGVDLMISLKPFDHIRTISPYGGYLIKRIGKTRVCIWARFDPPLNRDSIRFLYLKQKPMLEMRSDYIITIGDSNTTINKNINPVACRFDFAGRGLIESARSSLQPLPEAQSIVNQYDSILSKSILKLDKSIDLLDSLKIRIGVDSINLPKDLDIPELSGDVRLRDLGVLRDLSVMIDSLNKTAIIGLEGNSIIELLLR